MKYELAASSWDYEEIDAIHRVIASDRYTIGDYVAAFEEQFASYIGLKHAVMVNSGSSANLIAVASLCFKKEQPLKRGDEAIVPAIAWSTTYHPLQQYGLKLKIIDVELETLNMDVSQLEAALTPNTKIIVPVSILGNPANLEEIRAFADKHGLYVFEDNCESLDAEIDGRKTGTFGDVNTFSFFFSHHIATMEGGMVATNDTELYHLLRSLRAHGWTRDVPDGSDIYQKSGDDFFEAYRFILPGYNVRPIEMAGAIGIEQLKKLPNMTEIRRKNLKTFQTLFGEDERFIIQRETYGASSSFCFPMIFRPGFGLDREKVFATLRDAGIGFRIITGGCIVRHDVIAHYDFDTVGNLPNAKLAHDQGFFVGNHPRDISAEIRYFRNVIEGAFD
ncbi:MAG: pyridoxamine 5-phosphate oxidase [Rhodospirillaceae bacterium]|nr:pyridoxamine 5-phosphate oxidase [Rhodospirillaceae bacterium]